MSKILRRPMFRGGQVIDSRGTGITSGLMDGGRVGYQQAGFVVQPPGAKGKSIFDIQDILAIGGAPMTGQQILDFAKANQMNLGSDFKINPKTKFIPNEVIENEGTENEITIPYSEKIKKEGFQTYEDPNEKYLGSGDTQGDQDEIVDLTTEQVTEKLKSKDNDTTGNNTSKVEMSAQDLIRENAELFKELLGEGNEKKLKDARIQDASDYLLKFFEGSQKEGATVGSSGAEVAAFATSRPSKTEQAKASIEKGDQTAIALAINDYIAGKRSKEQTDQLITKLGLSAELKKGNVKEQIRDATVKLGGSPPISVLQSILAADGPVEVITKEQVEAGYEPAQDGSDDGKYYLEEDTKTIYKVVGNKKVRI